MSKTILMTGAGSGFGKGTVLGLAKKGHKVIATCENWPQVTELKAAAEQEGVEIEVAKMDLLNKEEREFVFEKYADDIDILAPNAATGETGPIAEIPVDRVRRVFEVNVFCTLEFIQPFARHFVKKGKGKIIFTSSIAGFSTFPFLAPYCASKHALEAIVQLMREEMEGTGVQIATINPGPFRTGFNDRMYDTLDQWYDPERNFTSEKPVRDTQQLFAGEDLQLDPQGMIDFMIETIPQDHHKFRNVYPPRFIEDVKKYQESLWDIKV
ncbi:MULTISPECIES: SDR family oxidoreductase [Okeania]|uniref:SDR family oxidoreductase n=1 Tax=Okeania hirsuta TaxID=1458930 RepID=A0A3N6PDA5_9CYAN|nr:MULTISPECIES: SDR family oxidoreductase [Okeania]NET11493.1 SDR family oxidoreductase [Okeania sp. SIO1H6]NES78893.1 SDR family oxidoreductase [Okeania sp. SIO1H4]NES87986.1 SDR family oxidoreductase [Okeania sp. SIO2B9]NET22403.1 SDR family oxidoreductase [Okeania sp. SIO1H5]NET79128.1 SDR family oxidoreductase [Okeania sp. SIO1F9]